MTVHPSQIDGPFQIPIYNGDGVITGYQPGCHVNVPRVDLTPQLAAFEVFPVTPTRRFSGDELGGDGRWALTAFLLFVDEAEAASALG